MKKCLACGFVNTPERTRCLKCDALLESRALPAVRESAIREGHGVQMLAPVRRLLFRLSNLIWRELPENVPHRWVWTAALWAMVVPGGGAWYNHQPIKAGLIGAVQLGLWITFLASFFAPWNDVPAVALALWIFFAMADAFVTANRLNGALWGLRHLGAVWFAMMFTVGALVFITNLLTQAFVHTTTVRSDVQRPGIRDGDKLMVLNSTYAPKPVAGSIIFYDPGRYLLRKPNATYGTEDAIIVNEKSALGVVTATEGQVMSMSADGLIRVDGQPVPARLLPPNPNGAALVNVKIPPGHYGVLVTHGAYEAGAFAIAAQVKGHGGIYASEHPTPRDVGRAGLRLDGYDEAVIVPADKIFGTAFLRYYPPPRRAWWGFDGPLWAATPADYPRVD